jgi:predicted aspartyl protease
MASEARMERRAEQLVVEETGAKGARMGRIVANVKITNLLEADKVLECDALVDTGTGYLALPETWRPRLGNLHTIREIDCEAATQDLVKAAVCGPVEIRIEGFDPVYGEVLFLDMHPSDGLYEPLLGYIPLEQSQAAVDMLGHRLVHVKRADLK